MKKQPTFESAAKELEDILQQLSADEVPLDFALSLYAKAAELIQFCSNTLQQAQLTLEEIDTTVVLPGEL